MVAAYLSYASEFAHVNDLLANTRLRDETEALESAEDLLVRTSPRWLLGYRDVTNTTNERTVVGGVFPLSAVGHNLPLWATSVENAAILPALLSSFACDFFARLKMGGTHLTFFIAKQILAIPPRYSASPRLQFALTNL